MNRKKAAAVILAASIIAGNAAFDVTNVSAAQAASEKEEVVYVMTDASGKIDSVNVVNIFGKGDVTDHGDYSSVKMLTSTDEIKQDGDKITFSTDDEKVYYQGTLENAQIPWNIAISYTLDGKEISPEELAGKSGALKIHVSVTENTKCTSDFYDNYALQAAFTLDTALCKNIVAEGATLANVGSDKQISYTVLPGKGLDADITADVTDFEMDAAAINGVKLDLAIDVDDEELMDKVTEIQDAVSDLNDGAKELKDGTAELSDGSSDLNDGANSLYDGANSLSDGAASLYDGAGSLKEGIDSLNSGAGNLNSGISQLNDGIKTVQDGLNALNGKSGTLKDGSKQVYDALKTIQASLSTVSVTTDQLQTLTSSSSAIKQGIRDAYAGADSLQKASTYAAYEAVVNQKLQAYGMTIASLQEENANTIASLDSQIKGLESQITGQQDTDAAIQTQITTLNNIKALLTADSSVISGTQAYFDGYTDADGEHPGLKQGSASLASGLSTLNTQYAQFDAGITELSNQLSGLAVNMTTLKTGIDQLVSQYGTLDAGINDYTDGVAQIVAGYSKLVDGASNLSTGSKALVSGASQLSSGSAELVNGSRTLSDGSKELLDGSSDLKKGTSELYDGVQSLYDGTVTLNDGTQEFYDKTNDMDTQVQDQIDEMIDSLSGSDTETVSFVSDKNTNVDSVQFVIKTAAIEKAEAETATETETVQTGFFQKLVNLFVKK